MDRTPQGEIIRRFSTDLSTIDFNVAPMAFGTIHFVGLIVCIIVLIAAITPLFLTPGLLISVVYITIGGLYLSSSRELKRVETSQHDPLHESCNDVMRGSSISEHTDMRIDFWGSILPASTILVVHSWLFGLLTFGSLYAST